MISIDITLLIHIVNMIVLMFVLNAILYKPVLGMLDQRARKMTALNDEVAQYEETARQRQAELDKKMREASNRAKKALDGARSQAQAAGDRRGRRRRGPRGRRGCRGDPGRTLILARRRSHP